VRLLTVGDRLTSHLSLTVMAGLVPAISLRKAISCPPYRGHIRTQVCLRSDFLELAASDKSGDDTENL